MSSPVVFDNYLATGKTSRGQIETPVLGAFAPLSLALAGDRILVPTPAVSDQERFRRGLEEVPKERRRVIRAIDRDGAVYSRVHGYLAPLWDVYEHEDGLGFVRAAEEGLYLMGLAAREKASVGGLDLAGIYRSYMQLDPGVAKGEAAFRLNEIAGLFASVRTFPTHRLSQRVAVADGDLWSDIWQIIDSAKMREIIQQQGRVGYLRNYGESLRLLSQGFKRLAGRPEFGMSVRALGSVAGLVCGPVAPAAGQLGGKASEIVGASEAYSPPFFDFPTATRFGLGQLAVRQTDPTAQFRQSVAMNHPPITAGPGKCNGKHSVLGFEEVRPERDGLCGHVLFTPRWGRLEPLAAPTNSIEELNKLKSAVSRKLLRPGSAEFRKSESSGSSHGWSSRIHEA